MSDTHRQEILQSLLQGLVEWNERDAVQRYPDAVQDLLADAPCSQPEEFFVTHMGAWPTIVNLALRTRFPDLSPSTRDAMAHVYLHYEWYETHLNRLIEHREGPSCSYDKVRWILLEYLDYLRTGVVPGALTADFWIPKTGTFEDWMQTCEHLYHVYTHPI